MAKTLTSSGWPLNGLIQEHIGTHGNVYFVNDNTSISTGHVPGTNDPSHGGSQERPWASLNYAFQELQRLGRDNYGDVIVVGEGHTEVVTAAAGLDCDVAGVTVIFAGRGNERGSIAFSTAVGADMDIDAADITFINARFIASIDALTGPIDINAARFKLLGRLGELCEWADGTTINTTDCVVGDANADDCVIDGFRFIDGDGAGTQKQSFIQFAAATRPTLRNIYCTGDFATGIIENGTAWVDALLENVILDNANVLPTVALLLQATSSGWCKNVHLRVASGTTFMTANNDMQFARDCGGYSTDASGGQPLGTALAGSVEGTVGAVADAAATGAVTSTDTLMAYTKQLVTELQVVDEFHDVPAADNTLNAQMNEVIGNKTDAGATGVVTATDTLVAYIKQLVTLGGTLIASHVKADVTAVTAWTTANSPVTIFTVTGDVLVQLFAVVSTNMTSTATTGTLEAGVVGSTASLLVQDTVDSTAFQAEDCWSAITPADNPVALLADEWALVSSNIILTIATNNMASGGMTIYCRYIPISAGASVVTT